MLATPILLPAGVGCRCEFGWPEAAARVYSAYAQPLRSVPVSGSVPISEPQRQAAAELLAALSPLVTELGVLFARHGHELALVGGPVRDVFLGRPPGDLDLTTDALPERVMQLAKGWADSVWPVGLAFGTVGLRKDGVMFEITTYRTEQYSPESRKPTTVRFGASLTEDLVRRDFTVNAMAARLPGYELLDPHGGLADVRRKVLRTPGRPDDSLGDDPLRMLRAARFVAQLGFDPDAALTAAMARMAPALAKVSAERITAELIKLLVSPLPGGPSAAIALLVETGVAEFFLPEVPRLRLETDEHFRHKDVYQHSLMVLDRAIGLEQQYGLRQDLVLRLAALLHDIGKPRTRSRLPDGRVAFHHHEIVGAKLTRSRLGKLRFPREIIADVSKLVELHLRFHGYGVGEWTDSAVRRYVRDAGPLLTRLHALTRADCTTRNRAKAQQLDRAYDGLERRIAELAEQEELASIRPDLNGNEIMRLLGVPQGPVVGKAYSYLLELRLEHGPLGPERAARELLRWARPDEAQPPPGP